VFAKLRPVVALIAAACASTVVGAADGTVDFSSRSVVGTEQKQPGIAATISAAPEAGGREVFKLVWPAHEGIYLAGYIEKGGVLVTEPGKYRITAKVCVEQLGKECPTLALRLLDKNWETYQLVAQITPGEPGWVEVSWMLDTDDTKASGAHSWGGDGNGMLDLPIRLRGFAISFTGRSTNGGTLLVDQMKATPVPAK
jgi:hypothetical protein